MDGRGRTGKWGGGVWRRGRRCNDGLIFISAGFDGQLGLMDMEDEINFRRGEGERRGV